MIQDVFEKLKILAGAARYDVSCSSSGSSRKNIPGGLGDSVSAGICHSFTEDGRCISLLKVLLTNHCIYDCAYCVNRRSNDIPRTAFSVNELVDITINFYRRNYIEGLFLSSGVIKSPDYTMEQMVNVAKDLRITHKFNGYIHLKSIIGSSMDLVKEAGQYADRLSVNIEIPTEPNLKYLAPDKTFSEIYKPMGFIKDNIISNKEEKKKFKHAPIFTPAGQSTQLIIGATPENDMQILNLASELYKDQNLKRVYYSGYIHVNSNDNRLPSLKQPPLIRENRLYQADWLLRFYKFSVNEIVNEEHSNLDMEIDPKLSYALRNPWIFPIDINKADYEMILRVPGIGVKSAKIIVNGRRYGRLGLNHLKKIGVVLKKAKYFITCSDMVSPVTRKYTEIIKKEIMKSGDAFLLNRQLSLFENNRLALK